jgi:hypothetical protein
MAESGPIPIWLEEGDSSSPDPASRVQLAAATREFRLLTVPCSMESWLDGARVRFEQDAAEQELSSYLSDVRRADSLRPEWTRSEIIPKFVRVRINLVLR